MAIANIILFIILFIVFLLLIKVFLEMSKKTKSNEVPKIKPQKVISTSTPKKGVQVDVLKLGSGPTAQVGKTVQVHYTAWLENGLKVDSSYDKGEIFSFKMGRREVIPGWEAGMLGMLEGEKRKFTIEPDQAYGASGKANVPPNAVIIFEVELIKVV